MNGFLAALTPAMRERVEAAIETHGEMRLELAVSRYIDDEGNWPTDPSTATFLARQFLHTTNQMEEAQYSGSGLSAATVAGLAGAAVSLGGAKGATVLTSKFIANYWEETLAYSTGMSPILISAMKRVFDRVAKGTVFEQIAEDLTPDSGPSSISLVFGDGYQEMLESELLGGVARAAWRGARSALNHTGMTIGDFSQENPWVESYVSRLSQNQADLSRRTINQVVNQALERGETSPVLAQRLRQLWNLSPQHAQAVENYRAGLKKQERSFRSIWQLTDSYAARLRDARLRAIGDTEAHTAFNLGREAQWRRAVQAGELPLDTVKMWVTAKDELVCKVCRPMDGVTAPLGEVFPELGLLVPTAHPNCRCIILPVQVGSVADFSRAKKLIFPAKAALINPENVNKHLGGKSGKKLHPSGTPQSVHAGYDAAIMDMKEGAYDMPMSWLRQYVRGSGLRIGQRNRVKLLANKIMEEGFTKPITLWVYEDGPFIRDGMHRLEAANRIGLDRVPVALHHVEGNRPKNDFRGLLAQRRLQRQSVDTKKDTPFRSARQERHFIRWFNNRMERRGAEIAEDPPKRRVQLTKSDAPVSYFDDIAKKEVKVKEHTRDDGTVVSEHWRTVSDGFQNILDEFSKPALSQTGEPLTIYESTAVALVAGVAAPLLFRQAVPLASVKAIANPVQTLQRSGQFLKGMSSWVGGGSRQFRVFLEGQRVSASNTRQWTAFADGLDQLAKRKTNLKLHRGMTIAQSKSIKVNIESFTLTADDLRVGHTFDMAPSSFTRSKAIASSFTSGGSTKHGTRRIVLHVDRGSNSARIADVSPMIWEREYVGWGTYKINKIAPNGKGWTDVWVSQTNTYSLGHLARNPPSNPKSTIPRLMQDQKPSQMSTENFLEMLEQIGSAT